MKNMEPEMTTNQFVALRTDVKSILNALEGNKRFGQKGLAQRVCENEEAVRTAKVERNDNRQDLENFKTKIIAYAAGAAAVATAVIQTVIAYLF